MSNEKSENLIERSPVIVIMGHIDHGKSTLLDYIRETNIVDGEAGSITQHVSAYEVNHKDGKGVEKRITFIDTPGHAAFSAMRSRGASIADIAILIISAEDGVKTQTIEAYKSIQEAKIPFIVAINKIDKPNANIEKIKTELIENEIYLEGSGGDIPFVAISAKSGEGIPELLDTMLLITEMEEYKGDISLLGEGIILESKMDSKRGVITTAIIKNGTLKQGNFIIIDNQVSPIRILEDFQGNLIKEAIFSSPIKIIGCCEIPEAGSSFKTYDTKKEAEKSCGEKCVSSTCDNIILDNAKNPTEAVEIFLIIKVDVFGTIEAIKKEIAKITTDRVIIKIIFEGVGDVTENDIKMASHNSNTLIVGFNTKINQTMTNLADQLDVKMNSFNIIYKLTEWLEENIKGMIPKIKVEEKIGEAKILAIFNKDKDEQILGGKVKEGKIKIGSEIKIMRRDFEIGTGLITNLQSQKIQTKEVAEGEEFGIGIKAKNEIAIGDYIEVFETVEK
ncbi:MAG: translation initiation factor IF-2 [Candidatus Pacebacteria bacterium]|nr:translation initiation factor IF-2 [Candidatus Paceibacterota bacterium]